jgi:hypothetical protein
MPSHDKKPKQDKKKPVQPPVPKANQPQAQKSKAPQQPKPVAQPRDLADPTLVKDATSGKADPYGYRKNDRGAQLIGPDGVKAGDVKQGAIADCFLAAGLASVAGARSDVIRQAMKDNKDGTFTVRFFELDYSGKKTAHFETVDADLPHDGDAPAYAKSTEVVAGKAHMELWPSIIEKAYAQWKGSYDAIGHGGIAGDVMTALTGQRSQGYMTQGPGENDPLWAKMKQASDQKKPMTAGSGNKDDARYKDPKAGVYGWHAYSVLGVEEAKEGDKTVRYVVCRNPWGKRRRSSDAAAVGDTKNDSDGGVFKLPWAEFRRLYDDVTING